MIFIKIRFWTVMYFIDNSFVFTIPILIITIQLCVLFDSVMPSKYYCPRCQSENIIVYDDKIECVDCGLSFSKETILSDVDEDNYLAEEELQGFCDGFTEEERERLRRLFEEDEDLL